VTSSGGKKETSKGDAAMMSNQEVMEKAAITTAHIAAQGKLTPEQSAQFLDYVEDETSLKGIARIERITAEQKYIEKIGVGKWVMYPMTEGVDPQVRRGVQTSRVILNPVEAGVPFEIGDRFKKYAVGSEAELENLVIRMMAKQFANNLELLCLEGQTVGPTILESDFFEGGSSSLYIKHPALSMRDGWLYQAESGHVVDAANAAMSSDLGGKAIRSMPTKFRKNRAELRFIFDPDNGQIMREYYAARATSLGDAHTQTEQPIPMFGVKVHEAALLDPEPGYAEDSTANTDGTTPTALSYKPVTSVVITKNTIGDTPEAAYVAGAGNDYTVDLTNGTWTRLAGGNIGSGEVVRVTYKTAGRMILTPMKNLIVAVNKDEITLEKQRNIHRKMWEYILSAYIDCAFEETDAVVLLTNVKVPD
jgi:hypothetical protein